MNDLHVDCQLLTVVADDQNANGAAACLKSLIQARPQVGLVNDRESLLDVTGLSHGNNSSILNVQDSVLFEDRSKHGLNNNTRGRVGNEGALLVQLLCEQIDTKVAVLACGGRSADLNDLARPSLEDQQIPHTDVVAWDGDGVVRVCGLCWCHLAAFDVSGENVLW